MPENSRSELTVVTKAKDLCSYICLKKDYST